VERLNAQTRRALSSAAVKEQFAAQGLEPTPSTVQEFSAYLKSEVAKWARVIKASGAANE
jgi:tripartite-type tricarboxylate transporter receptor subunit TctC